MSFFEDAINMYGVLMLRLSALSISCVVLIKLPFVVSVSFGGYEVAKFV